MAFKHNELGALVVSDPTAAFERLSSLFAQHKGNLAALSRDIGVHKATIHRWLDRLVAEGHGDPRGGARGVTGRKPKGATETRVSVTPEKK